MKYAITILIIFFLWSCGDPVNPYDSSKINTMPVIDFEIDSEDYNDLMENKLLDFYTPCLVDFKENVYKSTVRAMGAGSRYQAKWAYMVSLDEGRIMGLDKFNLSSQAFDRTMLHSYLASGIYAMAGFHIFESNPVFLRINGKEKGLYPLLERIEPEFFSKRGLKVFELYKCKLGSKFTFEQRNNPQFEFVKKIPDDNNYNSLKEMIRARDTLEIDNIFAINTFLDLDIYLNYHALTSILNNNDAFKNNFYLWKETPYEPFRLIPWDFDKCFSGNYNDPPAGFNELITKFLENEEVLNIYKQKLRAYLDSLFTEENLYPRIDSLAELIRDAYQIDPYLGDIYDFDYEISELKKFIRQRRAFLYSNIDSFRGVEDINIP